MGIVTIGELNLEQTIIRQIPGLPFCFFLYF